MCVFITLRFTFSFLFFLLLDTEQLILLCVVNISSPSRQSLLCLWEPLPKLTRPGSVAVENQLKRML